MPQGRIISNHIRLAVIVQSKHKCCGCGKPGFVEKQTTRAVLVEKYVYKKWLNEYDGTFIFAHRTMEFDHIIPLNKGGKTTVDNLQILCRRCNRSKGGKLGRRQDAKKKNIAKP